jgi:hypothetical protein
VKGAIFVFVRRGGSGEGAGAPRGTNWGFRVLYGIKPGKAVGLLKGRVVSAILTCGYFGAARKKQNLWRRR